MPIQHSSNSSFDDSGYYTGPETYGIPTKFGPYGDPGMEYGTLEERRIASHGIADPAGNISPPLGYTDGEGWDSSYGFRVEPQKVPVFDRNGLQIGTLNSEIPGTATELNDRLSTVWGT